MVILLMRISVCWMRTGNHRVAPGSRIFARWRSLVRDTRSRLYAPSRVPGERSETRDPGAKRRLERRDPGATRREMPNASRPSPALSHGGARLRLRLSPLQRVIRLARRQLLRRKVVNRDCGGDRDGGGTELLRLGLVDQALAERRVHVAHVRLAHALADGRRRDDSG